MTNKELIRMLLDTDLNQEVDLKKTIGDVEFKPVITATWKSDGNHAVVCSHCECRVSKIASTEMDYCFKCGAQIER